MKKKDTPVVDFHEKIIQGFIEKIRPPIDIRDQVDIGYTFQNRVLEIFEIRPSWNKKNEKIQHPVAKTRFIKSRNVWRNYWMRANGKWEPFKPLEEVKDLSDFLKIVDKDEYGCFWG